MLQIYSSASDSKLKEIYTLQKKAVKMIFDLHKRHPTDTLFREGILPFPGLIKYEHTLLSYKLHHKMLGKNLELISYAEPNNINTRSSSQNQNQIQTHFPRTEVIKRSFFYTGLTTYNQLPSTMKQVPLQKFKAQTKELYKNCTTFETDRER